MPVDNSKGCFVAVVGPSGAGKDTIMDAVRAVFKNDARFHFVRRIITRDQMAGTEDHDSLTEAAFHKAVSENAFALHWNAHGLNYALPQSVNEKVLAGKVIVANVSRNVLNTIRDQYPFCSIVMITAHPEVLAKRLALRGRETEQDIAARLKREISVNSDVSDMIEIDNSDDVTNAINAFTAHLNRLADKFT
ncbi:phosphonate metabolism protein/1,5-bisphosphokinase (PRPP-forming) PhnN [Brucellaceae bacterium C25G]